ncbi:MAG: ATP synthase subunit C [Gammaproteobacteria bacterium]|nr:ATP synthase subunit C [Gammaproteobacteria bacterium]MDH5800691.1 ATP synthase subunit C [Gammaproteobacteria bacterium]
MKSNRVIIVLSVIVGLLATLLMVFLWVGPVFSQETTAHGTAPMDPDIVKWGFLAAALSTALAALGAGYAVAAVGSAAIGALAEKPELFGRVMIFVGLAEGIAIYGLIISILILNRVL